LWQWLKAYERSTLIARDWATELDISKPKKTRAIAPTGTISIVAETTSGIEPIFCVAYKRRYLKHNTWHYQYVVDPVARRLIDSGVKPEEIEDAYDLSRNVEKRVEFQHWIQQSVDHCISSTVNLPHWGSAQNNDSTVRPFGDMLMKYLPELRGITCFPDGARDGQPLTPVKYATAMKHVGSELVEESTDICFINKGGSCGD
jgi:ribonucleoside-diphosphate reductase alpha chain